MEASYPAGRVTRQRRHPGCYIQLVSQLVSLFNWFLSDEGPMLETLDYTIRIGSTPTFLYFDLYLYSAYAAHFVYLLYSSTVVWLIVYMGQAGKGWFPLRKTFLKTGQERTGKFPLC